MLDRIDIGALRSLLTRWSVVLNATLLAHGPQMLVLLLMILRLPRYVLLSVIMHLFAPILPNGVSSIILRKLEPLKVLGIGLRQSRGIWRQHGPLLLIEFLLLALEEIFLLPLQDFFLLILNINGSQVSNLMAFARCVGSRISLEAESSLGCQLGIILSWRVPIIRTVFDLFGG